MGRVTLWGRGGILRRYRVRQTSKMLQPANPLLQPWDTPFQLPPFDRIQPGHFAPAFEAAVREHAEEIAAMGRFIEQVLAP